MGSLCSEWKQGEALWPFDVESDMATLSCARLLDSLVGDLGSVAQPAEPQLLQCNLVHLEAPAAEPVVTKKGDRLFFKTTMRDFSGDVEVAVTQEAALALSGTASKEEFVELFEKGELQFAPLANVRIVRTTSSADATDHRLPLNTQTCL